MYGPLTREQQDKMRRIQRRKRAQFLAMKAREAMIKKKGGQGLHGSALTDIKTRFLELYDRDFPDENTI